MTMLIARHARHTIRRDEDGSLTPFTVVIFLMMVVVTGMAVDLMRHEAHRAEMQNALDRGLLAATDLDQQLTDEEAEALVKDYFRSALWVGNDVVPVVNVGTNNTVSTSETGVGERSITANARLDLSTAFLRIIGRPNMPVIVQGGAEEKRKDVELSLVLDISGTMRFCGTSNNNCNEGDQRRMDLLIPAAQDFIDRVVQTDSANTTSINLVPYAGQVNPGPGLFAALGGQRRYLAEGGVMPEGGNPADYEFVNASCLEFTNNDFLSTGLPAAGNYDQVPHFHHWALAADHMNWGWCPSDETAITIMNGVEDQALAAENIKNRIGSLTDSMHDGTGTNNAMKWALALLDPSARDTLSNFVPQQFAGKRPANWDAPTTLKVIVLMTDGQITGQYRPDDPTNPDLDTKEVLPNSIPWSETTTGNAATTQFEALCTRAKNKNVIIYTIAFYAPSGVKDEMQRCATDPATNYFDVQGLEIATAFNEIATTLSKVKLTQ